MYAVWLPMVASDRRDRWPSRLLTDRRVRHWWDSERKAGDAFAFLLGGDREGGPLWDAFLLYDRDATWQQSPPKPLSWGCPLVEDRDRLRADLLALAKTPPRAVPAPKPTPVPTPASKSGSAHGP